MAFLEKITRSNFFIRLRSWEYWPFGIIQFPAIIYYLWLSLRARSLFFFSATNPGIPMGGMFGESKLDILKKIPEQYRPATTLVKLPATVESVLAKMEEHGFLFPVIFKPDIGERGFMVRKITGPGDVNDYLRRIRTDFLIQEHIDLPLEFGVFYRRYPSEAKGEVVSVTAKEMLTVTGDGQSTLRELIFRKARAKLQWPKLRITFRDRLGEVLRAGETLQLVNIGNHALGTKFLDGGHLITEKLSATFDGIGKAVDGFYFGRFDLRCARPEDLYEGNVRIVELNGCGAEPAHIYDPQFTLFKAVNVLLNHWKDIFVIARQNRAKGASYSPLREGFGYYKKFKAATR